MTTIRKLSRNVAKNRLKKKGYVKICKPTVSGSILKKRWLSVVNYHKHKTTRRKKKIHQGRMVTSR